MKMRFLYTVLVLVLTLSLSAQDAQWRGPDRNGVFPDTNLLKSWPEEGPKLLYMTEGLGKSYSSVVVSGEYVLASGMVDTLDMLSCMDHQGNILWQVPYGRAWNQSFPDTRCTPLVDENRVYVLSGMDNLLCANIEDGSTIWEVNIHETYNSVWDMFGVSESPLLIDNKIIVTPGGDETTVIALDKMTGELIWKSEALGIPRSNGSSVLFTNDTLDLEILIATNRLHILGLDPENGEIFWKHQYNFPTENDENTTILANTPMFHNKEIYVSNGWDCPSKMLELSADGKSISEKYTDPTLDNQNHGLIRIGDFIYGSNFLGRTVGKWVCMRWENGEIMWVEEWETKGPIIYADGLFYLMDEKKGNVALVKADEKEMDIISSFKVKGGKGPFWARPSIYGGKLYIRHGDAMLVYNLKD